MGMDGGAGPAPLSGRSGGGACRGGLRVAVFAAFFGFELHQFQGLGIELGLEALALGIGAAHFVAAIVDANALHLPAALRGHALHGGAWLPLGGGHFAIVIGPGRGTADQQACQGHAGPPSAAALGGCGCVGGVGVKVGDAGLLQGSRQQTLLSGAIVENPP